LILLLSRAVTGHHPSAHVAVHDCISAEIEPQAPSLKIAHPLWILLPASLAQLALAPKAPTLVEKDSRYALMFDGKPYLILGGQTHKSSAF
jgi:hypothetical protein